MVGEVEIYQEIGVRTIAAIVWLVRGPGQNLFEQPEVQVQQERAVEEKETPAAALSVAGTLQAANGKVGLAPPFDGCLNELGKGIAVALKDELIGGGDAVEWAGVVGAHNEGVIEHTRSLEHGPAPRAAA